MIPTSQQIICSFIDITERKRIEEALRESEAELWSVLQSTADGILAVGPRGNILRVNQRFIDLWRIPANLLESNDDSRLLAFVLDQLIDPDSFMKKVQMLYASDVEDIDVIEFKDGRHFERYSRPIKQEGVIIGRLWSFRDITEHKATENRIKGLLREKEILLKEVHHRIKNNLNTIISLLSLQADTLKDPGAIAVLSDAEARVRSIGMLWDKFYNTPESTELSVKIFLDPLIDQIVRNFPNAERVKIEKELQDFVIDARSLSALGILVNELLTNIMKHAFVGRMGGTIKVLFSETSGWATLSVQDDGVGIPQSVDIGISSGFGLQLVEMITEQLGGKMRIERGQGTKFVLEFEL
jgi:two-component sensor histidine kinase